MKKLLVPLMTSSLLLCTTQVLSQAQVEINWENPEKYRDVRPTMESRVKFREHTFEQLLEYLQKLAAKLPDDQKLSLNVTNLDLAGQVWPASFVGFGHGASDVRVIKNMDIPRISFTYKLVNTTGELIQEGDVELKDMAFMDRANRFFSSESLRYEKNMLKDWFDDEFPELMVKTN
ncbi:DUF3016 domain-containing protein [Paraglaciecola hydrolytica]|uniref:DUF3016 domain-containing protein n=1 Tax=Paraglaciecola hydrolytica TaxID=1799789 RepID=A0A136A6T6_9ALTE|nr:DUF3016 domain-containing protein [Paraglaciecola hydrolytica]KXI30942.1 hypothetical protein AX660_00290 [Paraglaciecola hydrolytica]